MVSVFWSDTVRPAASKTVTMTVIIFSRSPHRLRGYSCVIGVQHTPHRPLHACRWHLFSDQYILLEVFQSFTLSSSSLKRTRTTCIAAVNTLNSNSDSTQPCRSPCATSNDSECSPSSARMQARMPSSKGRVTVSILAGTPKHVSTCHSSSRSTESYAFCMSMKHTYKGMFLSSVFLRSSHDEQHVDC